MTLLDIILIAAATFLNGAVVFRATIGMLALGAGDGAENA